MALMDNAGPRHATVRRLHARKAVTKWFPISGTVPTMLRATEQT